MTLYEKIQSCADASLLLIQEIAVKDERIKELEKELEEARHTIQSLETQWLEHRCDDER